MLFDELDNHAWAFHLEKFKKDPANRYTKKAKEEYALERISNWICPDMTKLKTFGSIHVIIILCLLISLLVASSWYFVMWPDGKPLDNATQRFVILWLTTFVAASFVSFVAIIVFMVTIGVKVASWFVKPAALPTRSYVMPDCHVFDYIVHSLQESGVSKPGKNPAYQCKIAPKRQCLECPINPDNHEA